MLDLLARNSESFKLKVSSQPEFRCLSVKMDQNGANQLLSSATLEHKLVCTEQILRLATGLTGLLKPETTYGQQLTIKSSILIHFLKKKSKTLLNRQLGSLTNLKEDLPKSKESTTLQVKN